MDQHIIACPVLLQELKAVLQDLPGKPKVHLMDYSIHINADTMEQELHRYIGALKNTAPHIGILLGKHCKAIQAVTDIARQCEAKMPHEHNCIEMILGVSRTKKLQENRTIIMTPGWITMMQQSIKDGNWRVEDARTDMGWYEQILLLDTGTEPLTDEIIMNFFELTRVPIDILKVDLNHFKQVVDRLLQQETCVTEKKHNP